MAARILQLLGAAPNLVLTPTIEGAEVWAANNPRILRKKGYALGLSRWTRWINLHSFAHMERTYPNGVQYYRDNARADRPVYLQRAATTTIGLSGLSAAVPHSRTFPAYALQMLYSVDGRAPFRYFTFSGAWMLAWALALRQFERIELYGFELKREHQYDYERPCMAYWVTRALAQGVEIVYPVGVDFGAAGDPAAYAGPLYGYETTEPHCAPPKVWGDGSIHHGDKDNRGQGAEGARTAEA